MNPRDPLTNIVKDYTSQNQLPIEQLLQQEVLEFLQARLQVLSPSSQLLTNDVISQMEQSGNMNMLLTQQQINSSENMDLTQTKLKQPMD